MSDHKDNRVTVRVEVIVDGVTVTGGQPVYLKPYRTDQPTPSPSNTPVRQADGVNYVDAKGILTLSGNPAWVVRAKAYPDPALDPTLPQFKNPPADAVVDIPLSDGSWSCTQAKNNQVPGAACDGTSGGPNNSTLLVWYGFPGQTEFKIEATRFHGYCPVAATGSGVGSGSGSGPPLIDPGQIANQLYATFTGDLAAVGTVTLTRNGSAWMGVTLAGGGGFLSFVFGQPNFTLTFVGATAFAVSAVPSSISPFLWSAQGSATGAANFGVNVTQ
jgi:hypothetical protein